jgi:hypothetical protein
MITHLSSRRSSSSFLASLAFLTTALPLAGCYQPGADPIRQPQVLSMDDSVQMFSLERSEGFLDLSIARLDTRISLALPVGLESVDFAEKLGFARTESGALTYSLSRSKTDLEAFQTACNTEDCRDITVQFSKTRPSSPITEAANFRVVSIAAVDCAITTKDAASVSTVTNLKFRSATIAKNLGTGKTSIYARSSDYDTAARQVVENVLRNTLGSTPVVRLNSISSSTLGNGQRRDVALRATENVVQSATWNEEAKTFDIVARPTAPATSHQISCKY